MRISVNPKSATPLYIQIKQLVRMAVATGALQPGDRVPTVRELATQLRINFNTVARSYREMQAEGLLDSIRGSGTFVSEDAAEVGQDEAMRVVRGMVADGVRTARNAGISDTEFRRIVAEALDEGDAGSEQ